MNNLKELRMEARMTQQQLSDLSGVGIRLIQEFEQNPKKLQNTSIKNVYRLARTLDVDCFDLVNVNNF